jgi:hypothetical protein
MRKGDESHGAELLRRTEASVAIGTGRVRYLALAQGGLLETRHFRDRRAHLRLKSGCGTKGPSLTIECPGREPPIS